MHAARAIGVVHAQRLGDPVHSGLIHLLQQQHVLKLTCHQSKAKPTRRNPLLNVANQFDPAKDYISQPQLIPLLLYKSFYLAKKSIVYSFAITSPSLQKFQGFEKTATTFDINKSHKPPEILHPRLDSVLNHFSLKWIMTLPSRATSKLSSSPIILPKRTNA